ncbi:MAG: protoporphyrinogen oxidase, partial [Anaerolineales bacterium]
EQEHGSVLRGALKLRASRGKRTRRSPSPRTPRSLFLTPKKGLAKLVDALEAHLVANGIKIHLNEGVETLSRSEDGYQLVSQQGTAQFDGLILATPAFISSRLLRPLSNSLADQLVDIDYASTATVNLAYRSSDVAEKLSGYGYVIPKVEARSALACTWTSTKFPHRAPEGTALVRVFIGRAGEQQALEKSDEGLIAEAQQELARTIGINQEPHRIRLTRWPEAMPQYNVGHNRRVQNLMENAAGLPGIELAGAGYHGIGIPDCINSGRQAARRLLAESHIPTADSFREKQENGS